MKRSMIVEIISALFILLFAYTAINKIATIHSFEAVLEKSSLIRSNAQVVAWFIPTTELIAVGLLMIPKTRLAGLYSSLVLMIIFTAYIGYLIAFMPKLPCSCGGVLKQMTWDEHLLFNILFTLLAFLGIKLFRKERETSRMTGAIISS